MKDSQQFSRARGSQPDRPLSFCDHPSDLELTTARVFLEPLVAMSGALAAGENEALAQALLAYKSSGDIKSTTELAKFLGTFPQSRWCASLEYALGQLSFGCGRLSLALKYWSSAWERTKTETEPGKRAIADATVSQLMQLYGRLGEEEMLKKYFAAIEGRMFCGSSDTRIHGAREQLALMQLHPETSFRCGPCALFVLSRASGTNPKATQILSNTQSSKIGNNLFQLENWANEIGLGMVAAYRESGAPLVTPSLVHWGVGHFAAVTGRLGNDYKVEDITFGAHKSFLMTAEALESETDGYFLIPKDKLSSGWRKVSQEEAERVWGKGVSPSTDPNAKTGSCPVTVFGDYCPIGIPNAGAFTMGATVNVSDVPLSYQPAIGGGPVQFRINYSYQEVGQPATFTFSNLGPNWNLNWISWVEGGAPSSHAAATVYGGDGGGESYAAANPYTHDVYSQALLVSGTSAYSRLLPDGSEEIFSDADGTGRYFLTSVIDPQGNTTELAYDSHFRLLTVTDAFGDVSSFTYGSNTYGQAGFYVITQITDPFGRTASFAYDASYTYLLTSTDQIGMQSSYAYSGQSLTSLMLSSMTTLYGQTLFEEYTASATGVGLKVTYPDGTVSQMETWVGGTMKTFYWDREAISHYPDDPADEVYTHCVTTHWVGEAMTEIMSAVPLWVQPPLDNQIWYMYNDCAWNGYAPYPDHYWLGTQTINKPVNVWITAPNSVPDQSDDPVLTILQDWTIAYVTNPKSNSFGYPTQTQDALATPRILNYGYASNNIDLESITQNTTGEYLGQWTFNDQHEPLTHKDGSGQTTELTYNSPGQLLTVTDALANVTTLTYSATGVVVGGSVSGTDTKVLSISVTNANLSGGATTVQYAVQSTDTLSTIAAALTSAINGSSALQDADITARWISLDPIAQTPVIYINSFSQAATSYSASTTGTGAETLTVATDTCGYLMSIEGALGALNVVNFTYDDIGRIASITNSEGFTVARSYDKLDRIIQLTYPDGTTDTLVYDKLDVVAAYDRIGRVHQYCYNSLMQLVYDIDGLGRETQYQWCKCGTLEQITDPNGNITQWGHDLEGRMTSKTYADSSALAFTYDLFGRLSTRTDALEQVTTRTYNNDNTLAEVAYTSTVNPTPTVAFTYDDNYVRLTEIKNYISDPDTPIADMVYSYNSCITSPTATTSGGGQIHEIENMQISDSVVAYGYDDLGRVTSRTINGSANSSSWEYDDISRITQEVNTLGTFNFTYIDNTTGHSKGSPLLSQIAYPNGLATTFGYFSVTFDQRLQQITNAPSSGNALSQFNHSYDPAGQIKRWLQQQPGTRQTWALDYDAAGQLLSMDDGDSSQYQYAYDDAGNRVAVQQSIAQQAVVGGTIGTGDTIQITVTDPALSGGTETVPAYTVQSGDTTSTIAAALAALVTADANLQAIGIDAISAAAIITLRSKSTNNTVYSATITGTETLTFGKHTTIENITIDGGTNGNLRNGDVVSVTVIDSSLSGGEDSVSETMQTMAAALAADINSTSDLSDHGISASAFANVLAVESQSTNITSYGTGVTGPGAAALVVTSGLSVNGSMSALITGTVTAGNMLGLTVLDVGLTGGTHSVSYTIQSGDTMADIAAGVAEAVNADLQLQSIGVTAASTDAVLTVTSYSTNITDYFPLRSTGGTATMVWDLPPNGTTTLAIGGSATTGDALSVTVYDAGLSSGSEEVTYTVLSSDDLNTIATALAAAINANAALEAIGLSATAVNPSVDAAVVNILSQSVNLTTYSVATSGGSTETLALGASMGLSGAEYNDLNQLTSIAAGGTATIEGSTNRAAQSVEINSNPASMASTTQFTGAATLTSGANSVEITATTGDMSGTTTNIYQLMVKGSASQSFSYDDNGNMTGDGTRTFTWDAENRLLQITYPGSGNNTQFAYDGLSRCVSIIETVSSTVTSTKQFIWCGNQRCEVRDGSGDLLNQYFALGQTNFSGMTGTNYSYTKDHLGSVREMTNSSGDLQAQFTFDPFGNATQIAGTGATPDFGYAGMYVHQRSGLNLTMYRAYSPTLGRWLSRDPLGESVGTNLYAYAGNSPVNFTDPSGLLFGGLVNAGEGAGQSATDYWAQQSLTNPLAAVPGTFSALWTPTTSDNTAATLASALVPNLSTWVKNPIAYEIGQQTLPAAVYTEEVAAMTAIQRGQWLIAQRGLLGALKTLPLTAPEFGATAGTGFTPGLSLTIIWGLNALGKALGGNGSTCKGSGH